MAKRLDISQVRSMQPTTCAPVNDQIQPASAHISGYLQQRRENTIKTTYIAIDNATIPADTNPTWARCKAADQCGADIDPKNCILNTQQD